MRPAAGGWTVLTFPAAHGGGLRHKLTWRPGSLLQSGEHVRWPREASKEELHMQKAYGDVAGKGGQGRWGQSNGSGECRGACRDSHFGPDGLWPPRAWSRSDGRAWTPQGGKSSSTALPGAQTSHLCPLCTRLGVVPLMGMVPQGSGAPDLLLVTQVLGIHYFTSQPFPAWHCHGPASVY